LLQPHRAVVANFVPGNFGLFRRNPWQPLAEPLAATRGTPGSHSRNPDVPRNPGCKTLAQMHTWHRLAATRPHRTSRNLICSSH